MMKKREQASKNLKYPNPLVISVDFDRVLHDIDHPIEGKRMGPPINNAPEFMKVLSERGFVLDVYTLHPGQEVRDWLDYYKIPYHTVSNIKPDAILYIDDKGYRFKEWSPQMIKEIYGLLEIDK